MGKFVVISAILVIMLSRSTATNNARSFHIKHNPAVYPNPGYNAPPQVPTNYRYDVRFNPAKYGYAPNAPFSSYAVPSQYIWSSPAPAYIAAVTSPAYLKTALVAGRGPSAPASYVGPTSAKAYVPAGYVPPLPASVAATYVPPHVLARLLQDRTHQFIDRHYRHGFYH